MVLKKKIFVSCMRTNQPLESACLLVITSEPSNRMCVASSLLKGSFLFRVPPISYKHSHSLPFSFSNYYSFLVFVFPLHPFCIVFIKSANPWIATVLLFISQQYKENFRYTLYNNYDDAAIII